MAVHWVLVADAGVAKVFESDTMLLHLKLVEELNNIAPNHLPGAGRTAVEAHHDPHLVTEERFARAVALLINEAEGQRRFERLVVVAPPRFLGDLRDQLSTHASRRVVASIHHDWTRVTSRELADQVRSHLPDLAGMP